MATGKCKGCGHLFSVPEDATGPIECADCGTMNEWACEDENPSEASSMLRMPVSKVWATLTRLQKRMVAGSLLVVVGILILIRFLSGESPAIREIKGLNVQAANLVFKNRPEEAMQVYNRILEKLRRLPQDNVTRQWDQKITGSIAMLQMENEIKLVRQYQPEIDRARDLSQKKQFDEADKIYNGVLEQLNRRPQKGKVLTDFIKTIETAKVRTP